MTEVTTPPAIPITRAVFDDAEAQAVARVLEDEGMATFANSYGRATFAAPDQSGRGERRLTRLAYQP